LRRTVFPNFTVELPGEWKVNEPWRVTEDLVWAPHTHSFERFDGSAVIEIDDPQPSADFPSKSPADMLNWLDRLGRYVGAGPALDGRFEAEGDQVNASATFVDAEFPFRMWLLLCGNLLVRARYYPLTSAADPRDLQVHDIIRSIRPLVT